MFSGPELHGFRRHLVDGRNRKCLEHLGTTAVQCLKRCERCIPQNVARRLIKIWRAWGGGADADLLDPPKP